MRGWGPWVASAALHALALGLALVALIGGESTAPRGAEEPRVRLVLQRPAPRPVQEATPGPQLAPVRHPSEILGSPRPVESAPGPVPNLDATAPSDEPSQGAADAPPPVVVPSPTRIAARLAAEITPSYPREARSRGWEGTVVLEVTVDENGEVESVEVGTSAGHAVLDRAALEAVRASRFLPALSNGAPEAAVVEVAVHFRLQ